MKHEIIPIGSSGATLETFFLEDSPELKHGSSRPAVVICPGGAYAKVADREADPIALEIAAAGIHACIFRYPYAPEAFFPVQLIALAQAFAFLRTHASDFLMDPNAICVCGFSAGGHLAASLGVHWNSQFLAESTGLSPAQMKPNAMVLGYPVITSGEFAHHGSIQNLLGSRYGDPDLMDFVSLENHVTKDTPPTFLWHTVTDQLVPVENAMLFASALRRNAVPFELHLYSVGEHGLALADRRTEKPNGTGIQTECAGWMDLATAWLRRTL